MKKNLLTALAIAAVALCGCRSSRPYMQLTGIALGTTYSIIYDGGDTLQDELEQAMADVEHALNIYDTASIISRINRNEDVALDSHFVACFTRSMDVYTLTGGMFDICSAPLFNAWGFGSDTAHHILQQHEIDSLKAFCGMDKVRIDGNRLLKSDPRVTINANASAKGYTVDVVSRCLAQHGIGSYLVEIGGEVKCAGKNPKGTDWYIGIDKPSDDNYMPGLSLQTVLVLTNRAIATSGNYRRYYYENNQKISHSINPGTGMPTESNLLSATVLADDCTTADALATALMAMGLESAQAWLAAHPKIDALLIYSPDGTTFKTFATPGAQKAVRYEK